MWNITVGRVGILQLHTKIKQNKVYTDTIFLKIKLIKKLQSHYCYHNHKSVLIFTFNTKYIRNLIFNIYF
jgi:hypothetical protein